MSEPIILELSGKVGRIILNNPDKLNCMGFSMLKALDQALNKVAGNPDIQVLLVRGAGDRAFSTGADLKEFTSLGKDQSERWIRYGNEVFNTLETLPIPTVALIKGYAVGGGLELALRRELCLPTHSTWSATHRATWPKAISMVMGTSIWW